MAMSEAELHSRYLWSQMVVDPANHSDLFHPYWLRFAPQSRTVLLLFGLVVGLAGIISVIGNGITCYSLLRSPTLRRQKMFTINMSFSDFASPLLTYHMFVVNCWHGVWIYSKNMCNFYAVVQGFGGLLSITSMALTALERYAAIVAPTSAWNHMTTGHKLAVIAATWAYCAIVTLPPIFGFGSYMAAGFLTTCCFDYINTDWRTRGFIIYLFSFGLGVPMVFICFCYVKIMCVVRQQRRRMERQLRESIHTVSRSVSQRQSPNQLQDPTAVVSAEPPPEMMMPGTSSADLNEVRQLAAEMTTAEQRRQLYYRSHQRTQSSDVTVIDTPYWDTNVDPKRRTAGVAARRRRRFRLFRKEISAARSLLLVIVVFVVAWVPYGVVALLGQFGPLGAVGPWLAMIPSVFAKASTVYNPLLYGYLDARFRRSVRKHVLHTESAKLERSVSNPTHHGPWSTVDNQSILAAVMKAEPDPTLGITAIVSAAAKQQQRLSLVGELMKTEEKTNESELI